MNTQYAAAWNISDELPMREIYTLCSTSTVFRNAICLNDDYWRNRLDNSEESDIVRLYSDNTRAGITRMLFLGERYSPPLYLVTHPMPADQLILTEHFDIEAFDSNPFEFLLRAPTSTRLLEEQVIISGMIPRIAQDYLYPSSVAAILKANIMFEVYNYEIINRDMIPYAFHLTSYAGEMGMPRPMLDMKLELSGSSEVLRQLWSDVAQGYIYGISVGGHRSEIMREVNLSNNIVSESIIRGLVVGKHYDLLAEILRLLAVSAASPEGRLSRYIEGLKAAMIWEDMKMFNTLLAHVDFTISRGWPSIRGLFESLLRWGRWNMIDLMIEVTPSNLIVSLYYRLATYYGYRNLSRDILMHAAGNNSSINYS